MRRWLPFVTLLCLALALTPPGAEAGVLSGNCRVASQPAASLLIPYFRVDLDDPAGATTLVSVNNGSARPALARVVVWTDWGVPTLAFDVYLTGFDVQTLNLRDLLGGTLPATGASVSNRGPLAQEAPDFPGCQGAPALPTLGPAERSWLRAAHTGRPLPGATPSQCAGSGAEGAAVATGYVTVDAVQRCTPPALGRTENTPADPAYFARNDTRVASDDNVLWGDYLQVDTRNNSAESQTAVHLVADADFFAAGDYTFYGRYVGFDASDARAPLSSLYYARFFDGGAFSGGTDLIVWRDTRSTAVRPLACGQAPSWSPLGELQLVAFDEEENSIEGRETDVFPLATQRVHVGGEALAVPDHFGWLMVDLFLADGTHAQGWVGTVMTAAGRFSVGHEAVRADDLCNFGP